MKKRLLALALALAMIVAVAPMALAEGGTGPAAQIGENTYDTLNAAIKAVTGNNATKDQVEIKILRDILDATGIPVPSNSNIVIDFDDHVYTLIGPGAGSAGTETNGFQLLKDSTITFKNGTIRIAENANGIKRIIQNYANLTLENMQIYAKNQAGGEDYALSFNNGDITFKGNTSVIMTEPDAIAFDVCYWQAGGYEQGVSVTFEEDYTGTVNGTIIYDSTDAEKGKLEIAGAGTFGSIKTSSSSTSEPAIAVSGGTFSKPVPAEYCAENFAPLVQNGSYSVVDTTNVPEGYVKDENGTYYVDGTAAAANNVAMVNGTYYSTIQDAISAAEPQDGVITYYIYGKAEVTGKGWIQVAKEGLDNVSQVKFIGMTNDAEICIKEGAAILADQKYDLDVSFENLTLSKEVCQWADNYGHSTNYFTTWLCNTDQAENTVTYTDCTFPNGACNNQFGKTVFIGCTFNNNTAGMYNLWHYGGNTEIRDCEFTGTRGVKVYTENQETNDAGELTITNTSFEGLTEKAAIVVSKYATISLTDVDVVGCVNGLLTRDLNNDEKKIALNGTGISATIEIKRGDEYQPGELIITSGTFTSDASAYLAPGLVQNSDGSVGYPYVPPVVTDPSYAITTPVAANGTVTVSPTVAKQGDVVTITATPNEGYELGSLTVTDRLGNAVAVQANPNGTYSFVMPNSQVTITASFTEEAGETWVNPFVDVDTDDWYYDYVEYVCANGLMVGTSDVTFESTGTVTRGTLMTILARLDGTDTTDSDPWYQAGMEWAVAEGVSDGTAPEGTITREQVATMLWRYAGQLAVAENYLAEFDDADEIHDWAAQAMNWAVSVGVITGGDNGLDPQGTATRAELAAMLTRFCENVL